jgi:hypothetical protein
MKSVQGNEHLFDNVSDSGMRIAVTAPLKENILQNQINHQVRLGVM